MPTNYPDVQTKTLSVRCINAPKPEVTEGGVIRSQDLAAQWVYEITLEHPFLDLVEVETLDAFWEAHVDDADIVTPELSDGYTYTCVLSGRPESSDYNDLYKHVRQKLVGTRNP